MLAYHVLLLRSSLNKVCNVAVLASKWWIFVQNCAIRPFLGRKMGDFCVRKLLLRKNLRLNPYGCPYLARLP